MARRNGSLAVARHRTARVPTHVAAASAASHRALRQCIEAAALAPQWYVHLQPLPRRVVLGRSLMLSFPELRRMHVPLATLSQDWRDLQVKHLVKNNRDEYILRYIRGVENVVNPNAWRCGGDTSKSPLDSEAPRDVVEAVPEELR
jgi:hypothetical protein